MNVKHVLALSLAATGLSLNAHAAAPKYDVVHSFQGSNTRDGAGPSGLMALVRGVLYGTTQAGGKYGAGTVFKLNATTGAESLLYAFQGGADGYQPSRNVVEHDGILYGTTAFGGQPPGNTSGYNENGTIFSIDLKTHKKTILFEFPNDGSLGYSPGDIIYVNGIIYGTTAGTGDPHGATYEGTLFSFDTTTSTFTSLRVFDSGNRLDGAFPLGGLIDVKGTLYGTTREGGNEGAGSVFSYTIRNGKFQIILSLSGTPSPTQPESTPVYVDGALYMTSKSGGTSSNPYGFGTVFKLDLTTLASTVVYSFQNGDDGQQPLGGLLYENGLLYGTTVIEGAKGGGALFSINPKNGVEKNLHSFNASNGDASEPIVALTDVKGTLFGTTYYGGSQNVGAIFSYTP